jgi:hypothetical protein
LVFIRIFSIQEYSKKYQVFTENKRLQDTYARNGGGIGVMIRYREDQGYCSLFDKRGVYKDAKDKSVEKEVKLQDMTQVSKFKILS